MAEISTLASFLRRVTEGSTEVVLLWQGDMWEVSLRRELVERLMAWEEAAAAVEDPAAEAAAAPAAKGEAPASTGNESELAMLIVRHAPTHPRCT